MIAQSQNVKQIYIFKKIYVCNGVEFNMHQFIYITNKMIQKHSSLVSKLYMYILQK